MFESSSKAKMENLFGEAKTGRFCLLLAKEKIRALCEEESSSITRVGRDFVEGGWSEEENSSPGEFKFGIATSTAAATGIESSEIWLLGCGGMMPRSSSSGEEEGGSGNTVMTLELAGGGIVMSGGGGI